MIIATEEIIVQKMVYKRGKRKIKQSEDVCGAATYIPEIRTNKSINSSVFSSRELECMTNTVFEIMYVSTRDLGGEPLHDQNRSLDQTQSELNHHRDAEAARAYARQGQSANSPRTRSNQRLITTDSQIRVQSPQANAIMRLNSN